MIKELKTSKGKELLTRNYIGHISYIYNNHPYVVPITFFYDREAENLISYAAEGQKIEAMRENPSVSLQVEEIDSLNEWKSVIAYGRFEELSGSTAQFELHKFCQGVKKLVKER